MGTAADLVLVEHYEDAWQFAPFALLAAAGVAGTWCLAAPGRASIVFFRAALTLLLAGGLVGLWLHYQGNVEFEREVSPSLSGLQLFWQAVKGASPPSLAPATLIHLGLLGLAATYKHPAATAATTSSLKEDR